MNQPFKCRLFSTLLISSFASVLAQYATAADVELSNGWSGNIGFQLQSFLVSTDNDALGTQGDSSRVMSGFDPSKLTVGITAPAYNGLTISGTYQLVQAINGAKSAGDATFNGSDGGQFQVRVAEAAVAGSFGTIKAGRGWAIFGSSSLLHDSGSLPGVGGTAGGGGISIQSGGTAGRINYGYYYPDFHAGIQYVSNDLGGLSFRAGLFDPINGANDRSEELRFEAEVNYASDFYDLWLSGISSSTEGDEEQTGFDVGGELRFSGLAVTAAFSDGTGIDCCAPTTNELQQWYVEVDYRLGNTLFGGSYGEHELDADNGAEIQEGDLTMLFAHYELTPQTTLVAEWNNESVENATGDTTLDADTIAFGINVQF